MSIKQTTHSKISATENLARLRIALVMRDYSLTRGGAERYCVNFSRALAGMGHEVHVFAATFAEPQQDGIHYHLVPMVRKPAFFRLLSFLLNTRKVIRQQGTKYDMVQSLTMFYPSDVQRLGGEVQREWLRIRCPSPVHRIFKLIFNPVHIFNHYIEKKIMDVENTAHIITISSLEKEILRKYYDYPKDKITVVYNGVDHRQFNAGVRRFRQEIRSELGIEDAELVGLFSANNFHRKGLDAVIGALALIPDGNRPRILVTGRGNAHSYQHQAKRSGVDGSLIFVGSVQDPERYYGASDFFVLPSLYDSFANVHLEALACGLPVITTRMAGGSEVVKEGETGFVVDHTGCVREIADAMTKMLDREGLRRMTALAPSSVRQYTLQKNAEETLRVYQQIISERGAARQP